MIFFEPARNDRVAKPSPGTREARRLSDDHEEGIDAMRHRDDAVDATSSSEIEGNHAESLTVVGVRDFHGFFAEHHAHALGHELDGCWWFRELSNSVNVLVIYSV